MHTANALAVANSHPTSESSLVTIREDMVNNCPVNLNPSDMFLAMRREKKRRDPLDYPEHSGAGGTGFSLPPILSPLSGRERQA